MLNGSFSAVSKPIFAMDFQLELGFYSNDSGAALCTLIVCIGLTPETFAQGTYIFTPFTSH